MSSHAFERSAPEPDPSEPHLSANHYLHLPHREQRQLGPDKNAAQPHRKERQPGIDKISAIAQGRHDHGVIAPL